MLSPGKIPEVNITVSVQGALTVGNSEQEYAALIRRVAGGDHSALATIYDSTCGMIFGLVLRIIYDNAAAEEVLLDVYKQVWRQAALYDDKRGSPIAWLVTIARSRALDRLRAFKREQQLKQAIANGSFPSNSQINPEQSSMISEQREIVRAALASLPIEQCEVIELAYYSGLSQSEIAEKLDQPLGTVKTRTRLGLMKLRQLLNPMAEEHS